jgi:hypothetical protein
VLGARVGICSKKGCWLKLGWREVTVLEIELFQAQNWATGPLGLEAWTQSDLLGKVRA